MYGLGLLDYCCTCSTHAATSHEQMLQKLQKYLYNWSYAEHKSGTFWYAV